MQLVFSSELYLSETACVSGLIFFSFLSYTSQQIMWKNNFQVLFIVIRVFFFLLFTANYKGDETTCLEALQDRLNIGIRVFYF